MYSGWLLNNQFYKTLEHYSTVLGCLVTYNKLYYYTAYLREQRLGLWRELDWNSESQVRVDSIRMTGGKSLMENTHSLVRVKLLEEQDCTYMYALLPTISTCTCTCIIIILWHYYMYRIHIIVVQCTFPVSISKRMAPRLHQSAAGSTSHRPHNSEHKKLTT